MPAHVPPRRLRARAVVIDLDGTLLDTNSSSTRPKATTASPGPRDLRRPRHAALRLPEARQRAQHLPARIRAGRRALRPLLVHRPARARHASKCAPPVTHLRGGAATARSSRPNRRSARVRARVPAPLQGRAACPGLPRFCGGLVGYFGYDTSATSRSAWRPTKPDPIGTPDILLLLSTSSRWSTTSAASCT
jgi:anthranilate/para-aminobenzoate synthase component I